MTAVYFVDLTFGLAWLMIACAIVCACAVMMLPLRQRVITLLVIAIVGISGCLWSLF